MNCGNDDKKGKGFPSEAEARSLQKQGLSRDSSGDFFDEEVGGDGEEEDAGDDAVHGEEGGVEAGEIIGRDEAVLVEEQRGDQGDAEIAGPAEVEEDGEGQQREDDGTVKCAGDAEGGDEAKRLRNAVQPGGSVVVIVLTGVEDVEAGGPEQDDEGEQDDSRRERATDSDPGGGRRDAEREAENEVAEARPALHVGVTEEHEQDDRREQQGEAVELPAGEQKSGGHDQREAEDKSRSEQPGGDSAGAGAGIGGVKRSVCPAIEGHGGRACGDHGDDDPERGVERGQAVGGEDGSGECEGERKDRVFPLDHFEGEADRSE